MLDNVKAQKVNVKNVGDKSLYIKGDSSIGLLIIEDTDNNAHIVIDENAKVESTTILSGSNIEVGKSSKEKNPFGNINIAPKNSEEVILSGKFDNIKISKPSKVVLKENCIINSKLDINCSVKLINHSDNVERVNINTNTDKKPVEIYGNLNNVNAYKGNINIKQGSVELSCKDNNNVKINVDKNASVITDTATLKNVKSEGKTNSRNKNSEAKISKVLFKDAEIYDPNKEIRNIPGGIKVRDLLNNIQASKFSKITILDEKDNKVNDDDYVTLSMKILIESEDGKNKAKYILENFWRDEAHYKYFDMYDKEEVMKDENNKKGFFKGELEFKKIEDDIDIDGYYVTIQGRKLCNYDFYDGSKMILNYKNISQRFVKKSDIKNGKYKVKFDDVDLQGYNVLGVGISMLKNNRVSWLYGYEPIYDNPISNKNVCVDGLEILDFKDTNNEKGKISGNIKFTKSKDESNIYFYQLDIFKKYKNIDDLSEEIEIVDKSTCKNGIYEVKLGRDIIVGDADTIKIIVTPISKDGIKGKEIEKVIYDEPISGELISSVPKLQLNDEEPYSLIANDCIEGNQVKLYINDFKKHDFVPYTKNNKEVVGEVHFTSAFFNGLEPGVYKAIQILKNGSKTDMSNEVIVKPQKLVVTIQNLKELNVSILEATDGATINIYDKDGKRINQLTKEKDKTPIVKLDITETYYI